MTATASTLVPSGVLLLITLGISSSNYRIHEGSFLPASVVMVPYTTSRVARLLTLTVEVHFFIKLPPLLDQKFAVFSSQSVLLATAFDSIAAGFSTAILLHFRIERGLGYCRSTCTRTICPFFEKVHIFVLTLVGHFNPRAHLVDEKCLRSLLVWDESRGVLDSTGVE